MQNYKKSKILNPQIAKTNTNKKCKRSRPNQKRYKAVKSSSSYLFLYLEHPHLPLQKLTTTTIEPAVIRNKGKQIQENNLNCQLARRKPRD